MGHNITVNEDHTEVGGTVYNDGDTLVVTDALFDDLTAADAFTDSLLTDNGEVADPGTGDAVFISTTQPNVTSTVAAGANPTKAEFDALRTDLLALRTALTGAPGAGKPLHT